MPVKGFAAILAGLAVTSGQAGHASGSSGGGSKARRERLPFSKLRLRVLKEERVTG
jgi:hypothetical protein